MRPLVGDNREESDGDQQGGHRPHVGEREAGAAHERFKGAERGTRPERPEHAHEREHRRCLCAMKRERRRRHVARTRRSLPPLAGLPRKVQQEHPPSSAQNSVSVPLHSQVPRSREPLIRVQEPRQKKKTTTVDTSIANVSPRLRISGRKTGM